MGLYVDRATAPRNARLMTLGKKPLLVRWTGEPVWVPTHWLCGGRSGRSTPCLNLGDGCPMHATARQWHVCTPALMRIERPVDPSKSREHELAQEQQRLARFRQLPLYDRERLLGEAETLSPHFARRPALLELAASSILATREPGTRDSVSDAPPPAALATSVEPVIIDLPPGAAKLVHCRLGGGNWRGHKCRLQRPQTLRETTVEVLDEPLPAELPEAASVIRTLCDMWGFNPERVTEEIDAEGRTVLRFPLP